ncbi:MAG: hypothetical protein EOO38_31340, partial [Cytophagaceae bacterium]
MIPDVAIGAVIAALIGAMISLVSLIVAKEGKVSEFRQAWIDELRRDLAQFLANLNAMEDAGRVRFENDKERFEKTRDSVSKLNEAYFAVTLRLNPEEGPSQNVKASMVRLAQMVTDTARDESKFTIEKIGFIGHANALLKAEWVRVRDGERTYNRTRRAAFWTVIVLITLTVVFVVLNRTYRPTKPLVSPKPSTTVNYSRCDPAGTQLAVGRQVGEEEQIEFRPLPTTKALPEHDGLKGARSDKQSRAQLDVPIGS